MTELRACAYEDCAETFTPKRPHQRFHHEACRYAQWELDKAREHAQGGAQRVESLDEVRAKHEESKGRWTVIVREHLNRTLVLTGYVSAEDFDALGIPPEHSNLANAQMGSYSKQGFMEAISWHRSKKPSRKSGKVWVHKLTEKGREHLSPLVGSDRDASPVGASQVAVASSQEQGLTVGSDTTETRKGERDEVEQSLTAPSTGRGLDTGAVPHGAGSSGGVRPGEGSTEVGSPQQRHESEDAPPLNLAADLGSSPDSLVQLDGGHKAPSMYDPYEDAA